MPYAVFPRTTGRDYAGTVIDGPEGWIGARCSARPAISASAATAPMRRILRRGRRGDRKAQGNFVGGGGRDRRALCHRDGRPAPCGLPKAAETVLVMGVNGKVGQAATPDRKLARRARHRRGTQGRGL